MSRLSVSTRSPVSLLYRLIVHSSLLMPTIVLAATPVAFDGWSVNNGVIDASSSCSNGVTCNTLVQDDGFLYQEVVTPQGSFYRTIITEEGATGNAASLSFADETFIPFNNLTGVDISNKQAIRDPASGFESTAVIDRDPFINGAGDLVNPMVIDIDQTLAVDGFLSEFHLLQNDAVVGTESYFGKSMDIVQSMTQPTENSSDGFQSGFDLREREGWQLSEQNNELVLDPFTPAGSMTLGGTQVDWEEGDRVRSTWIASLNDEVSAQGFAAQKIENLSTGVSAHEVNIDAGTVIDPFAWNENTFGAPPSLPRLP